MNAEERKNYLDIKKTDPEEAEKVRAASEKKMKAEQKEEEDKKDKEEGPPKENMW